MFPDLLSSFANCFPDSFLCRYFLLTVVMATARPMAMETKIVEEMLAFANLSSSQSRSLLCDDGKFQL